MPPEAEITSIEGSSEGSSRSRRYPLWERTLDLFLDPGKLFTSLRQRPRLDALALSMVAGAILTSISLASYRSGGGALPAGSAPGAAITLESGDLPVWVLASMLVLGAPALWGYVALLALVGRAMGGALGTDLPYRHWLSLAAHCSLVSIVIVPLQVALSLVMGTASLQLSLAELLANGGHPEGAVEAFLSRCSLRSLACVALFTAGGATFTRARWWKASAFIFPVWSALWFIIGWFTSSLPA
ncbi:MAG: hypothetical protein H0V09_08050 [Gemmatimonadetes bacterium]|nr:hypothetical protein [Gemmatimonadota bacterium]